MAVLAAGERFPALVLPDAEGARHRLGALWESGGALIVAGHTSCPTTRLALPYVDRVGRRGGSLPVAAILQERPAAARAAAEALSLALPVLLDEPPYAAGDALGLETVPTLFHVDGAGTIVRVVEGFDRDAFADLAAAAGVVPLFDPDDPAPRQKPG